MHCKSEKRLQGYHLGLDLQQVELWKSAALMRREEKEQLHCGLLIHYWGRGGLPWGKVVVELQTGRWEQSPLPAAVCRWSGGSAAPRREMPAEKRRSWLDQNCSQPGPGGDARSTKHQETNTRIATCDVGKSSCKDESSPPADPAKLYWGPAPLRPSSPTIPVTRLLITCNRALEELQSNKYLIGWINTEVHY